MVETSGLLRFEPVDRVEETERGLLARLHGETLRLDLVRDDVVRVKISRGGVSDESPTFAVGADPLVDGDGYPEFARQAFHLMIRGAAPDTMLVDGERIDSPGGRVAIPNAGTAFTATFDV